MTDDFRRSLKYLSNWLPLRARHALVAAFPEKFQNEFSRLIEVERLKKTFAYLDVDCVFDIGANEGQYALQLRQRVGYQGQLISFEPTPVLAAKLRNLSSSDSRWCVEEVAMSDASGSTKFNIMKNSQFSSISSAWHGDTKLFQGTNVSTETIDVRSESLEDAYARISQEYELNRPFLKMDTQGYDMVIARASGHMLNKFVGIQTELSVKRIYEDSESIGEAISFFQESGFELSALIPNNQGHFPLLIEIDGIFVRRT